MNENENQPSGGPAGVSPTTRRRGRTLHIAPLKRAFLSAPSSTPVVTTLTEVAEGAELEQVVVHVLGEQMSANFYYQVDMRSSFDGVDWSMATTVIAFPGSGSCPSYRISAPLVDRSKFGRFVRFDLQHKSSDGNAASANVSMETVLTYLLP